MKSSAEYCAGFSRFHQWFEQFLEIKVFYLLTANICGLNHKKKPGLSQRNQCLFLFFKKTPKPGLSQKKPGLNKKKTWFKQKKTWFRPKKPGFNKINMV